MAASRVVRDDIGERGGKKIMYVLIFRAREFCKWAVLEREYFNSHCSIPGED